MGGSSKSSSASSSSSVASDERVAATDNASVRLMRINGSGNVLTDYDAIETAGEGLITAINNISDIAMLSLNQNAQTTQQYGQGVDAMLQYKTQADQDKDERLTTKLAPYLLAGVSVLALTGKLKLGK